MANNKVQLADGTTLIDLTSDTVTPQTMLSGTTAHAASGEPITGVVNLANAGTVTPHAATYSGSVGSSDNYAREDHAHPIPAWLIPRVVSSDLDLNTIGPTRHDVLLCDSSCTNMPGTGWWIIFAFGSSPGACVQIGVHLSGNEFSFRVLQSGIWTSWKKIDNVIVNQRLDDLFAINDSSLLVSDIDKITVTSLVNGTPYSNYGGVYYYKVGKMVFVNVGITGLTANRSPVQIFSLPAGYRPYVEIRSTGDNGTSYVGISKGQVRTDGSVMISSSDQYAYVQFQYIAAS